MTKKKGTTTKDSLFLRQLLKTGLTTEQFYIKMKDVILDIDGLYPATPLSVIRLLRSGKKEIFNINILNLLKLCYTLNCTPNDLIPNIKNNEIDGKWN